MSYIRLCKLRISLLASFSTLAGAMLGSPRLGLRVLVPWLGVLILACGASALNQAQEWKLDSKMERTRGRPVPSGVVSPGIAFGFAGALIVLGLAVLAVGDVRAALLGIFAVGWYNGLYTRLKRASAFAAVPGALTGVLPPAIGWTGAGGSLGDPGLLMVCLLLFVWQVPHFWLLLLDRGREYARAGLPALTDVFSGAQIRRIVSLWILGTAACALLISISRLVYAPLAGYAVAGAAVWLGFEALRFRTRPARSPAGLFRKLNLFLAVFLAVLCLGRIAVIRWPAAATARMSVATTAVPAAAAK